MKHTKEITLAEAMERRGLTQQQVEDATGVDRTWISKLLASDAPNPTLDTYKNLVNGLRALGVLKRTETLVFGRQRVSA